MALRQLCHCRARNPLERRPLAVDHAAELGCEACSRQPPPGSRRRAGLLDPECCGCRTRGCAVVWRLLLARDEIVQQAPGWGSAGIGRRVGALFVGRSLGRGLVGRCRLDPEGGCERSRPEAAELLRRREHAHTGLEQELQAKLLGAALARANMHDHRAVAAEQEADLARALGAHRWVFRCIELDDARTGTFEELLER